MTGLHSHQVLRGAGRETADHVTLGYEDRFLRRKRLTTAAGTPFLVDLPETTSLQEGDAFALSDGTLIGVRAAPEPLIEVTGPDLPRLAWHIGNRHTPCQIEAARLLIAQDHVLAGMLTGLGASLNDVTEPFLPEGGAYGHGRTMGHDHGPEAGHSHEPGHRHVHVHVSRAPGDDPEDVPLDV
ncbi:urease accessory protein UreE [Frigidibacter sp.]|uniref:urease accessory protein UreE n=1 Tax=Frigidibacter sp. TaxID=2586418 RepID=UPI002735ED74|nr:urease accessory protein UreE [Frigidibacter sp.]MDP3340219.1 urease accessory protein UreE [Frigidibacter sp.]